MRDFQSTDVITRFNRVIHRAIFSHRVGLTMDRPIKSGDDDLFGAY